jgi:uncharacterized membrane protein YhhN
MQRNRPDPLYLLALLVGASHYADHWLHVGGPAAIVWKGAGVALLALWARGRAVNPDGRMIAAVLGLGALGDVLLETHGLVAGAVAFLAGHAAASWLYLRHRRVPLANLIAPALAAAVAVFAWWLFRDQPHAILLAPYVFGLTLMAGSAVLSRLGTLVALGAVLFFASDWLIFLEKGPLAGSSLPGLLIWPSYFAGQALIAWGAVHALARERTA